MWATADWLVGCHAASGCDFECRAVVVVTGEEGGWYCPPFSFFQIMAKFLQARRRPVKYKKKKQWTVKKPVVSSGNSVRVTEQTGGKLSWYLRITASVWILLSEIRNAANCIFCSVLNTFIYLYLWSFNSVKKKVIFLKNIVAPPILYQREVHTLKKRLQKLELEFVKLQLSLSDKATNTSSSGNSGFCSCGQATTATSIKESNVESTEKKQLPIVPLPPPLPPPPPPPLPPLLLKIPVLPQTVPLQNRGPLLKKVENNQLSKMAPGKQEGPVHITLRDLMNVKLRKTRNNIERQKMGSHKYEGISRITISDLNSINLKSTSKMPPKRLVHVFKEALKSPIDLRRHLKKVNMVRSPGGTPIYDRDNKENGTGLTPLMTKALRRKFQMAHPKSPSPRRMSPRNQGLE